MSTRYGFVLVFLALAACGGGGNGAGLEQLVEVLLVDETSKVDPVVDTQWSTTRFFRDNVPVGATTQGNVDGGNILPALQPGPAVQLTGVDLVQANMPFPPQWSDGATLPTDANRLAFEVILFDERDAFQPQHNQWEVDGLEGQTTPCTFPAISFEPGTPQTLVILFTSDGVCGDSSQVRVRQRVAVSQGFVLLEVFNGTYGELKQLALQDARFKLDFETTRSFTLTEGVQAQP